MLTHLRIHRSIIAILILTVLAFYALFSRQSFDAGWMLKWNHVDSGQVQFVYAVLIGVTLLALPFAAQIEAVLRRGRIAVFILATIVSFLSISLLEPIQEHRLFVTPFSIWVIIAHIVALTGLAVWLATQPSSADESVWFKSWFAQGDRLLIGLYATVIIVLIGLHIASVDEFSTIDVPDEPWLASMATNYAENNDLSPSFIGSSYGSPDPVLPRYYLLMGLWLRPAGSSLASLRTMPLFILALVLVIMGLLLWRNTTFTMLQRLGGIIVLLSISTLVRASHSLRADVGLAVYGAVMVWAFLQMFGDTPHHKRWALIGGLALYIGLETIPFTALTLAFAAGVMLIIWLVRQRRLRREWQSVIIYALCCALAIGLYAAVRFLPDVQVRLSDFQRFNEVYSQGTHLGTLRFPIENLINSYLRFSLILSPVEFILIAGVLILYWYWGTAAQRWLLITFSVALVTMLMTGFAFSYWPLFVPLVAYAVACTLRSRRVLLIVSFVLIPALVAAPFYDMLFAVQTRPNQTYLASLDQLTPHVPPGTTLIGESALWFTLHSHRNFIGVDGFWIYSSGHQARTLTELVEDLGVNVLLCSKGNSACERIATTGLFGLLETYDINNSTYLLFWRTKS